MDMARKFIQMGRTRSLRYALRKGGRKYEQAPDSHSAPGSAPTPKKSKVGKGNGAAAATDEEDEDEDEKPERGKKKEIPRTGEIYDEGKLEGANIFEGYLNRCWEEEAYSKAWDDWREAGKKASSASNKSRAKG
jgi:hypothetical protein